MPCTCSFVRDHLDLSRCIQHAPIGNICAGNHTRAHPPRLRFELRELSAAHDSLLASAAESKARGDARGMELGAELRVAAHELSRAQVCDCVRSVVPVSNDWLLLGSCQRAAAAAAGQLRDCFTACCELHVAQQQN